MKTAYISFSVKGLETARRAYIPNEGSVIYCLEKYADGSAQKFCSLSELTESIFDSFEALVFISSVGIAVRSVAGLIRSKLTDPAVIAIDENGRFVVSVLSGHIGRANALSENIAERIGAVPVITTATDTHGRFSPDSFAVANSLVITDMDMAKTIAAASARGEYIHIGGYPVRGCEPSECGEYGVYIADNEDIRPFDNTLVLLPENIVVGVGCRRGTPADEMTDFVNIVLSQNMVDPRRVRLIASIDLKKDESAVLALGKVFTAQNVFFSAEELNAVRGDFESSDFVRKVTGTDNVCERSVCAAGAKIIVKKTASDGMTAAVGVLPTDIDIERRPQC